MSRTFTITKNKCYFCNAEETIRFNEHWRFCPECSAIYTYMLVLKTGCGHIHEGSPVVLNRCWFKNHRRTKVYIKYVNAEIQKCSRCWAHCEADGW